MQTQAAQVNQTIYPRAISRFSSMLSGCYTLPGNPEKDIYMIPCSGGADSTALAILMNDLYPEVDFRYFFTDTKADPDELIMSLDRLEAYLGKPIVRIVPDKGLYEKIDEYTTVSSRAARRVGAPVS